MLVNIVAVYPDCYPQGALMSLKDQFDAAVAASKQLPERPDNMTLLQLYGLFKQGSSGDVEDKRPGFTDMVGRAKWDAWNELKGQSQEEAMQSYIDLIESLQ
jgi:diazepam-binding inhibitor (GABA receptor modulating acyl-CoA-binding protein)